MISMLSLVVRQQEAQQLDPEPSPKEHHRRRLIYEIIKIVGAIFYQQSRLTSNLEAKEGRSE